MIKLVYVLRRLPHLSREEFQRYWHGTHAPLVRKHAAALRIHRYVQVHTLDDPANAALRQGRNAQEEYDGVAELWWESREALMQGIATPEGREAGRALLEDERNFIDLERSSIWIARERPVVEGDA